MNLQEKVDVPVSALHEIGSGIIAAEQKGVLTSLQEDKQLRSSVGVAGSSQIVPHVGLNGVLHGAFSLSRAGVVSYRGINAASTLVVTAAPKGVSQIFANDACLVCVHAGGVAALSTTVDAGNEAPLVGSIDDSSLQESIVVGQLCRATSGTSALWLLRKRADEKLSVTVVDISSSAVTTSWSQNLSGASNEVAAFSVDPAGANALVVLKKNAIELIRGSKVSQVKVSFNLTDAVIVDASSAVGVTVDKRGAASVQRLVLTSNACKSTVIGSATVSKGETPALLAVSDRSVVAAVGGAVYTIPAVSGAAPTSSGPADEQTGKAAPAAKTSLAALMKKAKAPESDSSAAVVEWVMGTDEEFIGGKVLRDTVVAAADPAAHPVVVAVRAKTADRMAHFFKRYLSVATDISYGTVYSAIAACASKYTSKKAAAGDFNTPADVLLKITKDVTQIVQAVAGKSLVGRAAPSASAAVEEVTALPMVEAFYVLLLHLLKDGQLEAATRVVELADGLVSAHSSLTVTASFTTRRLSAIVNDVGAWASLDAGSRLGKMTAHNGKRIQRFKEASVELPEAQYVELMRPITIEHTSVELKDARFKK